MISGIATAIKALRPDVRVIGVEAARNPVFHTMRTKGPDAALDIQPTLADALGGNVEPGSITIDIVRRLVDEIVLVEEDAIAAAIGASSRTTAWSPKARARCGRRDRLEAVDVDGPQGGRARHGRQHRSREAGGAYSAAE